MVKFSWMEICLTQGSAINVGISVSRVGGNAQIKSMKKVWNFKIRSSTIPWIGSVCKIGSDLDAVTLNVIEKGKETLRSWNKVWMIRILLKTK
jgi:F0F1-type ATP synthase alpha subunit